MSETFGVWELLTQLGQNELGETHLALRKSDQCKAVLKRFSPTVCGDASFYGPLKLELQLAARLSHLAAGRLLEQGEVNGVGFAAFAYVDGVSLAHLCRAAQATGGWPLSMDRAVSLMRPVLDALAAAHSLTPPLLHRDLVPQNVVVTCEGQVVVTDFGLGRARLRAGGGTGMRRAYVSPEQARGNAIDVRSEVFTAGLLLFELACGRLPAKGGAGEVISQIATGELDSPLAVNPMLDDAAAAVLKRALAIRPEDRFASAREFFEALAPWTTTKEERLAAWVTRLDAVKVEVPAAVVVRATPQTAPLVTTAKVEAVKRPTGNWRRRAIAPLVILGLAGAYAANEVRSSRLAAAIDPMRQGRPLEVTSIPSGAQVFVDGILESRRTPMTLHVPKDELRNIMLKRQGFGIWSFHVSNTRKLEVVMASGQKEEDRYEGSRPTPKVEASPVELPAPVVVEEATAGDPPAQRTNVEVVFDAEAPPVDVVLTHAHSVRGDTGPSIEIAAGSEASMTNPPTLYVSPSMAAIGRNNSAQTGGKHQNVVWGGGPAAMGSFRVLGLFAFKNAGGVIEMLDLAEPVTFPTGGPYHFFSPTESGELRNHSSKVLINDKWVALNSGNLLRVDQDDSFLIRVLNPKLTYRVQLTRADGSTDPLPVVLMAMRPDKDPTTNSGQGPVENSIRFDGAPLTSGQTIVGSGMHTFTGARNVWFTIVTGQGVVPPDVKLVVKQASMKQQR